MSGGWRALRRRILTPNVSATSLGKRGFHRKDAAATELLETIGRTFLTGYGYAAEARTAAETEGRLEQVRPRFRGFAFEGAAMGFAMRDGLSVRRHSLVGDFLAGPAARHIYVGYVGVGWAMARLPRFRWPRPETLDPLLRWLLLDGYGFHQAYFRTRRYVHGQYQDPRFRWPAADHSAYSNRVIDQGIGRALWFVCGADPDRVAGAIDSFAPARRGDLYSGAGLAATYAGGATEDELRLFWDRAGEYRGQLAQGSAFGAEARVRGGVVGPETELATRVFCGRAPEIAGQLTQDFRPSRPIDGELPAYEVWRQRVVAELHQPAGVRR